MAKKEKSPRGIGIAFLSGYVVLRMGADSFFWRTVSEYYAYAFEVIFCTAAYFAFRRRVRIFKHPSRGDAWACLAMLASGFLVYRLAKPVGIPIPFDLRDGHTLLLLLGVAPVLEELIFRMALWESFSAFSRKVRFALIGTTLLFAGGHFAAYPFVPEAYRGFVIYQTLYVLVLGAVAGLRRSKTGAVAPAIGVHFAFNFGFFLGGI